MLSTNSPSTIRCRFGPRTAHVLLSVLLAYPAAAVAQPGAATDREQPGEYGTVTRERIFIGPLERTFLAFGPHTLPPDPAVVLAFHGARGGGARMRDFMGGELERLAAVHGFVVLYPDGMGGHWNDCRANTPYPSRVRNVDDLTFVRGLIRWSEGRFGADPGRVRAIGFSNGAHFALRLALETNEIDAVVAIGAALPVTREMTCSGRSLNAAVMLINGTADPVNPYGGGTAAVPGGTSLGGVRSAVQSARALARMAGHRSASEQAVLLPRRRDGSGVERLRWRRPGAPDVVLITVHGGGHTIPGSLSSYPSFAGNVEQAYSAAGAAARFFERNQAARSGDAAMTNDIETPPAEPIPAVIGTGHRHEPTRLWPRHLPHAPREPAAGTWILQAGCPMLWASRTTRQCFREHLPKASCNSACWDPSRSDPVTAPS
jgi:polyhydroxybutyrate depolymerase